jgi:hypothetical protein
MSELSILELDTEHGELLPEREALGAIITTVIGGAAAIQTGAAFAANVAVNVQKVAVVTGSFNFYY